MNSIANVLKAAAAGTGKLALAGVSLAVALCLTEAVLAVSGYRKQQLNWTWIVGKPEKSGGVTLEFSGDGRFVPDDNLIFRMKPDLPGMTDMSGFRIEATDAGHLRAGADAPVVVLGDSFVWGDYVAGDQTFPHYLSELLGREVINAGVMSYGPDQEYALLTDEILGRRRIRPAAVVWTLYENDISDLTTFPLFLNGPGASLIRIPAWLNGIYASRALIGWLPSWVINTRVGNAVLRYIQPVNPITVTQPSAPARKRYALRKLTRIASAMKAAANSRNIRLITVIAPNQGTVAGDPYFTELHGQIADALSAAGLPVIDGSGSFSRRFTEGTRVLGISTDDHRSENATASALSVFRAPENDPSPPGWRHLTSAGNLLFAQTVMGAISGLEQSSGPSPSTQTAGGR